jgi:repressor LexA
VLAVTVGDRIRLVRLEQDVTQQELADYIGVSKQAVYKYENNIVTNIPTDKVDAIARKLNVSPAFLMGWEEQQKEKTEKAVPMDATPYDPQNVAPLLGAVRAGLPMFAEENIEGYIPIRQTDGARYFWLNVRGDSMNAAGMDEGDQILVREQPEVENGQLAVVLVNGNEGTVKYFRQEGDIIILTPKSFNPVHQPQIYDLKKIPVRVAGLVVECRKVF